MASRYFKLAFSTVGALGFGLVVAAIFLPETFNGIFNPEAMHKGAAKTEAERATDRAAAAAQPFNTETVALPETKDALDVMAESLKSAQEQQAAEVSAVFPAGTAATAPAPAATAPEPAAKATAAP